MFNEIESYSSKIEEFYPKIVNRFNKLQLSEFNKDLSVQSNIFLTDIKKLVSCLKSHINGLELLVADCTDLVEEIDQSTTENNSEYIQLNSNGSLSIPDSKSIIQKIPGLLRLSTEHHAKLLANNKESLKIKPINYELKIPVIKKLSDIPHGFYFYQGNIYTRIPNGDILKLPLLEIIDSKKNINRKHSIRCKYLSKTNCEEYRAKMASLYKSDIRPCCYAHTGDQIIKIGYPSRCPSVPNFGNISDIMQDIRCVNLQDIQNLLLYGLNDLISAFIWLDINKVSGLNANLEVV